MTDTERDTALRTAVSEDEAEFGVNASSAQRAREEIVADTAVSAHTERKNRRVRWGAFRLPEPLDYRPPSLRAAWRYARRGGWTGADRREVKQPYGARERTASRNENPFWTSVSASVTSKDGSPITSGDGFWRPVRAGESEEDLAGLPTRERMPFSRLLGVWYFRLAFPLLMALHYALWVLTRPSRALVVCLLWAVLMQVPQVRAVAEVLLPWNPWLWPWAGA